MSLNRFPGMCFRCGKDVPAGKGDFQTVGSLPKDEAYRMLRKFRTKWLVRCFACKGKGNKAIT